MAVTSLADPRPVLAQGGRGGGALGDVIVDALQELLRLLVAPIRSVIETHGDALVGTVVGTPYPNAVLGTPTNGAWPKIHDAYWSMILPLCLSLYGLAIGLVILFEATSHLFSSYHRSKLKRRAFSGLLGILTWWWLAALSLRFTDALTGLLVPSVSDITLFETLSFTGMGVLGVVIALSTNFVLFVLIGLIYLARQLALYLFVLLMPILIVLWIPGVGPFTLVARFMRRLAGFYVPFLFMTVPVALLFRLGDLLGTSAELSAGGIGAWLTALVIPFLAVLSPLVLFWQAGALFFLADRASRRVSTDRARRRTRAGREAVATTRHGGRNLVRGVRDDPAVTRDGQYVLDSGDSRAHAVGRRVDGATTRVRSVLPGDGGGGGGDGNGGSGGGGGRHGGSGGGGGHDGGSGGGGDRDGGGSGGGGSGDGFGGGDGGEHGGTASGTNVRPETRGPDGGAGNGGRGSDSEPAGYSRTDDPRTMRDRLRERDERAGGSSFGPVDGRADGTTSTPDRTQEREPENEHE